MANKRYYWLKLQSTFFSDKRIKRLRKIAGGDTYTIIYLKMLLHSLENEGRLYYEGVENSFIEELALDLDEEEDNIKVTISFLEQQKLIEKGVVYEDGIEEYVLTGVKELVGTETAGARRVRKHREALKDNEDTEKIKQKVLHCNTDVTDCNKNETQSKSKSKSIELEKELDKELEKEIDKELEKEVELEVKVKLTDPTTPENNYSNCPQSYTQSYTHNDLKRVYIDDGKEYEDIDELIHVIMLEGLTQENAVYFMRWIIDNDKQVNYLREKIIIVNDRGEVKDHVGLLKSALNQDYKRLWLKEFVKINGYKTAKEHGV